jgi:hypothetical protein
VVRAHSTSLYSLEGFRVQAPFIYGKVFEGDVDSHFLGLWTVYSKHEYYENQIHR